MYKYITVSNKNETRYAKVDTDMYDYVSQYKWYLFEVKPGVYYVATTINNKTIYLHRLIMKAPKGKVVDHRNHDTMDNTRKNLKVVTQSINCLNRKGAAKHNKSSGIRGVSWHKHKGKWEACIHINRKKKFLGYFTDTTEAKNAVTAALKEVTE